MREENIEDILKRIGRSTKYVEEPDPCFDFYCKIDGGEENCYCEKIRPTLNVYIKGEEDHLKQKYGKHLIKLIPDIVIYKILNEYITLDVTRFWKRNKTTYDYQKKIDSNFSQRSKKIPNKIKPEKKLRTVTEDEFTKSLEDEVYQYYGYLNFERKNTNRKIYLIFTNIKIKLPFKNYSNFSIFNVFIKRIPIGLYSIECKTNDFPMKEFFMSKKKHRFDDQTNYISKMKNLNSIGHFNYSFSRQWKCNGDRSIFSLEYLKNNLTKISFTYPSIDIPITTLMNDIKEMKKLTILKIFIKLSDFQFEKISKIDVKNRFTVSNIKYLRIMVQNETRIKLASYFLQTFFHDEKKTNLSKTKICVYKDDKEVSISSPKFTALVEQIYRVSATLKYITFNGFWFRTIEICLSCFNPFIIDKKKIKRNWKINLKFKFSSVDFFYDRQRKEKWEDSVNAMKGFKEDNQVTKIFNVKTLYRLDDDYSVYIY